MTTYNKRSEIRKTRARMQTIAAEGIFHPDPGPVAGFARECLGRFARADAALDSLGIPGAADVGILALALASLALRSLREAAGGAPSRINSEAGLEAMLSLFHLTLPLNVRKLNGALNELIRLAPAYRGYVCAQERMAAEARSRLAAQGGKASGAAPAAAGAENPSQTAEPELEHGERLFARSLARYQFGFDGHWMTRETASRLRLVRYYERTSGDFSRFVRRAWSVLAQQGAAYMAWQANFPIFICDLNNPAHLDAAVVLHDIAHGEAVMVSPRVKPQVRRNFPHALLVVEDATGALAAVAGNYGAVMLLERRLGGWTVTFPAGRVSVRELMKTTYGKLPVALALCAPENAAGRERVLKSRERKAQRRAQRSLAAADAAGTAGPAAMQGRAR